MSKIFLLFLVIIASTYFIWRKRCSRCGSFRTKYLSERRLMWADNVGGILKSGPFMYCSYTHHCHSCGNQTVRAHWSERATEHEIRESILSEKSTTWEQHSYRFCAYCMSALMQEDTRGALASTQSSEWRHHPNQQSVRTQYGSMPEASEWVGQRRLP